MNNEKIVKSFLKKSEIESALETLEKILRRKLDKAKPEHEQRFNILKNEFSAVQYGFKTKDQTKELIELMKSLKDDYKIK